MLVSAVLLVYALARLIDPGRPALEWQILGVAFSLPLSLSAVAAFLAAGTTAAGMDGLLQTHPQYERAASPEHWLLPALTAFVIGIPLYTLPGGSGWWLSFGLGSVLFLLVLIAEYIALDVSDPRYLLASAALVALSFALFLVLCAALEYANVRLVFLLLIVFPAATLVALRAIHLRLEQWHWPWALGIGLICAQIAAALHYWPISPAQYGLAVLAPLYALTDLGARAREPGALRNAIWQNLFFVLLFWGAALLLRP